MKKFIFIVIVFLASLSLFYILPLLVIFAGRENFSGIEAARAQLDNKDTLVGYAYSTQSFIPYKTALVKSRGANLIVLGTSRSMEFRQEFFKDKEKFANAGGAATSITDMENFIRSLDKSTSTTIILGVDPDIFLKGDADNGIRKGDKTENNSLLRVAYMLAYGSRKMYLDEFNKYSLFKLTNISKTSPSVGVAALIESEGFRSDGSHLYHQTINNPNLEKEVSVAVKKRVEEINSDVYNFPDSDIRESNNLKRLSELLKYCKENNIQVIGFIPPYPKETYKSMLSGSDDNKKIVTKIPNELEEIFKNNNSPFFNFTDISSFGGKDSEFIDFIHGSDFMYAKMSLYMAENDSRVSKLIDISNLRKIISESKNGITLNF